MASAARPGTVIIVDDDAVSRQVLAAGVRVAGAAVVLEAAGGDEALRLLPLHPGALVICDLSMPGMDGVQFARALRRVAADASLFVVSGSDSKLLKVVETLALRSGVRVVGSSSKPVAVAQLRDALAAANLPLAAATPVPPMTPAALRQALESGALEVHYLPKVATTDGALLGVEALARWQHPRHGLLAPQHFIPLAEQSGLIWDVTRYVTQRALTQVAAWRAQGLPLTAAINISAVGGGGLDFPDALLDMAREARIDPGCVSVELTESAVATSQDIYEIVARLWLKGFQISMDDYGAGNSGIEQLRRLPFSELKLDRSLVHGAADHHEQRAILQASIALARSLDLRIVAEGVEHWADWHVVARDCDAVQGYVVSPPLPALAVAAWAERWRATWRQGAPPPATPTGRPRPGPARS